MAKTTASAETLQPAVAPKSTAAERILDFKARIKEETAALGIELAKQLAATAETFKVLLSVSEGIDPWKDPQYEQHLAELKLKPATQTELPLETTTKHRKARVELDADKVLDFIGEEEKSAGDVQKKFDCSYVTASKFLTGLAAAKKLTSHKDGRTILYKAKK